MTQSIPRRPPRNFPGSSFRYTPLEHVRTVLVSFVQGLFAGAPPGDYHWNPDEGTSEIIIRDENPINVKTVGARPAVNFTMGVTQFYSVGMDDMMSYQFTNAKKTKGVLVPGVTTVNVSSRSEIEAQNLSWVISEHIWLLREHLMREGFFEIGRGITISPPTPAGAIIQSDQADEWYCCSISVPWQFTRQSAFTPLGQHIVNSIDVAIEANSAKHYEATGWPFSAHEVPVNIHECMPESFAPLASDAHGQTPDPSGVKRNPLPLVPHPLDPSKMVVVRVVKPHRAALRGNTTAANNLPLDGLCVKK